MTDALYCGDCRDILPGLAPVDAVICDPPYGLSFMGKGWDHGVPGVEFWEAIRGAAKPGAHLLAFGGTRTFHRLAVAIEDAGWEIRDTVMWVYGSGFPKSKNLGGEWSGWGTALKPAWEPIIVARKPLDGTVAANVLAHGTGALNVDGCRVEGVSDGPGTTPPSSLGGRRGSMAGAMDRVEYDGSKGRWPANLIHDGSDEVLDLFPESKTTRIEKPCPDPDISGHRWGTVQGNRGPRGYDGEGSAARFFYCAKASKADRGEGNTHPTVKPTALMRYLCRLVTPPGGTILDPFMGSGSTGVAARAEGFHFIGIDREPEYVAMARQRIAPHD